MVDSSLSSTSFVDGQGYVKLGHLAPFWNSLPLLAAKQNSWHAHDDDGQKSEFIKVTFQSWVRREFSALLTENLFP